VSEAELIGRLLEADKEEDRRKALELMDRVRARIDELQEELRTLGDDGGDFPPHHTEEDWVKIEARRKEIMAMIQGNGDILETFFPPKESKREPIEGKIY